MQDIIKPEKESKSHGMPAWVRKNLINGTSANYFATFLLQADKTRKEVMQMMGDELSHFLSTLKLQDILRKILSNATLEVHAKIRIIPDKAVKKRKKNKPT